MFKAEVVLSSRNSSGDRITTMLVTFPRFILAEFNTHRMFSRNSASSRAIPFKKMVESVLKNPFIPIAWQKDHKGMQGNDYVTNPMAITMRNAQWLNARDEAVHAAEKLNGILEYSVTGNGTGIVRLAGPGEDGEGITKQLCNRLLEPFAWHTCLVTATEWENFFALRTSEHAEIHIKRIADMMLEAYNTCPVQTLKDGEWHIPFAGRMDPEGLGSVWDSPDALREILKVSTAYSARVSYTVVGEDQKPMSIVKLVGLTDGLEENGHWSPFEHCGQAMSSKTRETWIRGRKELRDRDYDDSYWRDPRENEGWCGNFRGFIQFRKTFKGENRTFVLSK